MSLHVPMDDKDSAIEPPSKAGSRFRLRSSSFSLRPADVIRRQKSDSSFHAQFMGTRIGQESARRPSYESKTMAPAQKSRLVSNTCPDEEDSATTLSVQDISDIHGNSSHESASEDEEPPVPISKDYDYSTSTHLPHQQQQSTISPGSSGIFMRKATRTQSQSTHRMSIVLSFTISQNVCLFTLYA
jgi:hypothetical protein